GIAPGAESSIVVIGSRVSFRARSRARLWPASDWPRRRASPASRRSSRGPRARVPCADGLRPRSPAAPAPPLPSLPTEEANRERKRDRAPDEDDPERWKRVDERSSVEDHRAQRRVELIERERGEEGLHRRGESVGREEHVA